MNPEKKSYKTAVIKALAVLGLLALVLLVTFTTVSLGHFVGSTFSFVNSAAVSLTSLFKGGDTIVVKSDAVELQSGDSMTLQYSYSGKEEGSYALTYPCLAGFRFETKDEAGKTQTLSCEAPSPIPASNTMTLSPISTENRYVDMPITITYAKNGTVEPIASGTLTVTVVNEKLSNSAGYVSSKTTTTPEKAEASVALPKTTPKQGEKKEQIITTTTPVAADNPNGTADLKVTILEVGVVDKNTNAYAKVDELRRNDRIAVKFSVENAGTKQSGEWRFNAILPTFPPVTYNSDAQQSLFPGDHIEFTIGFDQSMDGKQTVKFVIDPQEAVKEVTEENNTASIEITVL